jgi:transposase InsO family protein
MKFRIIDREKQWHGVDALCSALGVTRGGYWAWVKRRPSARKLGDSLLLADVRRLYADGRKVYGSPRIHEALGKEGVRCGRKRVERLMKENGIRAKQGRKYKPVVTDSVHQLPIAPNVLNRVFERQRPDEAWVADTTYIWTEEGWLYLAVVLDLFSRRVVGWAMGDRNNSGLPLRALHMAAQRRRPPRGLIHHSDRGSTYASAEYQAALRQYGMICSMSRKGNCWDNAPMESWFHTLKVEAVQDQVFATRRDAMATVFEYMEVFYNRKRICSAIGGFTPMEYEQQPLRKEA